MDTENNCGLVILEKEYNFFNAQAELLAGPNNMIGRMKDKLIEIVESEQFKFKTVILNLILAQEYAALDNYVLSSKILDDIENEIQNLENINCDVFLFKEVSKAFLAVLKTCKAYLLIKQNNQKEASEIVKTIIPYANLDKANQASVYGIRSMVFMEYGLYGHKMALENAEKANKADPENPYWYFLIGKALGRIRRVEKPYDIPSDEERNALKTAIRMNENYLFILFTAESYVETSSRTYRFHHKNQSLYSQLKLSIDRLNEEASNLYKKSIELEPNCSHVLFRAARGFLNLPHPQRDPERAKALLTQGLKTNPRNPFANHLLARYYERFDHNIPKAIEYLEICTEQQVFGAEMDLLRLQFTQDGVKSKPVERLKKLLDIYMEVPRKIQILAQLASYYIFIEPNIPKACQLLKEAITVNCDDNILNHRSIFLRVRQPFSILDVLIDEIKIKMDGKCKEDDKKIYESFIFDLNESNIKIPKGRAKNLKIELLEEDKETRLGNYYRRPTNTNGHSQMRRRSYSKPVPSAPTPKINQAQSVQAVDNFFNEWLKDAKTDNQKPNGLSKMNTSSRSSLNGSYSDVSPASDSRFTRSYRRYDRSSRNDEFVEDFDRLSVSSNQSEVSRCSRGRGRSSHVISRSFQDRGDFDQQSLDRGRGRHPNYNGNRGNSNTTTRGRGFSRFDVNPQPHYDQTNNTSSRFKPTDQPESTSSNKNTSKPAPAKQNPESTSFKNWRERPSNKNDLKMQDEESRETLSNKKDLKKPDEETRKTLSNKKDLKKPDEGTRETPSNKKDFEKQDEESSDSDVDLMSYFKKK